MAASDSKSRVDLDKMRAEYEKWRDNVKTKTGPNRGQVKVRAVANIVENVHLEGIARGFHFESDEPAERGGTNLAAAPLSLFLMGAAF